MDKIAKLLKLIKLGYSDRLTEDEQNLLLSDECKPYITFTSPYYFITPAGEELLRSYETLELSRDANRYAARANTLSEEANKHANKANELSKEANALSEKANIHADKANQFAEKANDHAQLANRIAIASIVISVASLLYAIFGQGFSQ